MRKDEIFLEKNDNKDEIMLERLEKIAEFADLDLKELGFEEYEVKDVVHFNEEVELTNKRTGKAEKFQLYIAITENSKAKEDEDPIFEIEYLVKDDKVYTINDLILEYEGFENIRDVVERAKENEKLPEEKQDERFKTHRLSEEREKALEKEEKGEDNKDERKEDESELTNNKLKDVWQIVDIDEAYAEEWKTVRSAFGLPNGVQKLAIAKPMKNDLNALTPDMTIYMLDEHGNRVEEVNGKTIKDFFKVDRVAGKNSIGNKNTQFDLENEYAERSQGQILRSFQSVNDPELYIYANQKKVGEYPEVCVGKKSLENNFVGIPLETRNVEIQTNLTPQENLRGTKGIYHADRVDEEAGEHSEHGDDENNIALENVDGDERTVAVCASPYIPGTKITWEELSATTGERITKLQERFERKIRNGEEPKDIVKEIITDYKMMERGQGSGRRRI